MPDPLELRAELFDALDAASREACAYLEVLPDEPVLRPGAEAALAGWEGALPAQDRRGARARVGWPT